jgi:hypothetical protein
MAEKQGFSREKIERIAENIDRLVSLDIAGREFINIMYPPTRERHGRPLCLLAAEKLKDTVRHGDIVLIASGMLVYPLELAETDGPLGGAALARALQIGLGAKPIIVTDHAAVEMNKAVCRGASLNVTDLEKLMATERTISVIGFPISEEKAKREAESLFQDLSPKAILAVECRGRNEKGVYHALPKGRNMNHIAAKIACLYDKAQEIGALTIGIGDGGNEIGWGIVNDVIKEKIPYGDTCSCGCGGGFGDTTTVDVLVAASVSNWGAYGIIACLSMILNNPDVLHDIKTESRMLRMCIDAGGINGPSFLPEPKVDGLSEETDLAFLTLLAEMTKSEFMYPEFATR